MSSDRRTRGEVGLRLWVHGGRVYSLWLTVQNHHSLLLFAHFDPIGRPIKKQAFRALHGEEARDGGRVDQEEADGE